MYPRGMTRRIDDSHQPFKRTRKIGPGPRKRPAILQSKDWSCTKGKNTKTHYVQTCKWMGEGNRKPVKVKTKKRYKKAYNKLYRKWAAKHRKALTAKGAMPGYRCKKTKIARCK